jgi:hypothetical protein
LIKDLTNEAFHLALILPIRFVVADPLYVRARVMRLAVTHDKADFNLPAILCIIMIFQ